MVSISRNAEGRPSRMVTIRSTTPKAANTIASVISGPSAPANRRIHPREAYSGLFDRALMVDLGVGRGGGPFVARDGRRHDRFFGPVGSQANVAQPPPRHDGDPVANGEQLGEIRTDEDHSLAGGGGLTHQPVDFALSPYVDAAGR